MLSVVQAEAGWFGEGDDFFWVDGEKYPSIEGTGSEDYFNDAWGLHVNDAPYYGVTVAEGTGLGSRMTAYRWHLVDPVPFQKSLKVEIEHKGWTFNADGSVKSGFGERVDLMSSVAFWYQEGIAQDQPAVPYGSARLPQGNALQIEVERAMPEIKAEKGKVSVFPDLFWSKDVVVFEGEGPGSKITMPFDVPEDGDYELYAQMAQGSDYGVYTVLLDGKAPVAPRARARARRRRAAADRVRRLRVRDLRRRGLPDRLAAPDEGPPHADVRLRRQARGLERLHRRRGRHRSREDGRRGLGGGGEGAGAEDAVRHVRTSRRRSRIPTRRRAASRPWR